MGVGGETQARPGQGGMKEGRQSLERGQSSPQGAAVLCPPPPKKKSPAPKWGEEELPGEGGSPAPLWQWEGRAALARQRFILGGHVTPGEEGHRNPRGSALGAVSVLPLPKPAARKI